jgi:hypothetical protein
LPNRCLPNAKVENFVGCRKAARNFVDWPTPNLIVIQLSAARAAVFFDHS